LRVGMVDGERCGWVLTADRRSQKSESQTQSDLWYKYEHRQHPHLGVYILYIYI
jgi:hypothetical protein